MRCRLNSSNVRKTLPIEPGMLKTHRTKKSSSGDTINFAYYDSYFLLEKDFPDGTGTQFEADLKGQRTKMTDSSGEKRYTWDDADRLIKTPKL